MAMRRDRLTYLSPELLNHIIRMLDVTSTALLRLACRTLYLSIPKCQCNEYDNGLQFDSKLFRLAWCRDRRRDQGNDRFSVLPSELLLSVTSFLDTTSLLLLRQTCRRFQKLVSLHGTTPPFDGSGYTSALRRDRLSRLLAQEVEGRAPSKQVVCPLCVRFHPRSSFSVSSLAERPDLRRCLGHERVVRIPDYPDLYFSDLQKIADKMNEYDELQARRTASPLCGSTAFDLYGQQKRNPSQTYYSPHVVSFSTTPNRNRNRNRKNPTRRFLHPKLNKITSGPAERYTASFEYRLILLRTNDPAKPLHLTTSQMRERLLARCTDGDLSTASYICPHLPLHHPRILAPIRTLHWDRDSDLFLRHRPRRFRPGHRRLPLPFRRKTPSPNATSYSYPISSSRSEGGSGIHCPIKACRTRVYFRVFGSLAPYIQPGRKSSWRMLALVVRRELGGLRHVDDKGWVAQTEVGAREVFGRGLGEREMERER